MGASMFRAGDVVNARPLVAEPAEDHFARAEALEIEVSELDRAVGIDAFTSQGFEIRLEAAARNPIFESLASHAG